MAVNLLNTELLKQYSGTYTENYGEWVLRNGVWAMRLGPGPIYGTNYRSDWGYGCGLFNGEFKSNTRYIFDLWLDTDDIVYEGNNVPGGMSWSYIDSTGSIFNNNAVCYGNKTSPKGFQHIRVISSPNKTIRGICPYYYISTPAYYRYDSSITEYTESNFEKSGIIETGNLKEVYNTTDTQLYKGGVITTNEIKEI